MGNRDVEHNLRNNTVVVLAEESREVMTEACRDVVLPEADASGGASGASGDVLCMEGSPLMVSSLEMISACRARTIIILAPNEPTDTSLSLLGDDADASAVRMPSPTERPPPLQSGLSTILENDGDDGDDNCVMMMMRRRRRMMMMMMMTTMMTMAMMMRVNFDDDDEEEEDDDDDNNTNNQA